MPVKEWVQVLDCDYMTQIIILSTIHGLDCLNLKFDISDRQVLRIKHLQSGLAQKNQDRSIPTFCVAGRHIKMNAEETLLIVYAPGITDCSFL